MFDFRLKVFHTVAKRLNFTKAAAELFISQPAVTKHIKELEEHYKVNLFERSGNSKISLTNSGEQLLAYADRLLAIYRDLEFDMNLGREQQSGAISIGASTTLSQYILPSLLADFHQRFENVRISMLSGNTEVIEGALLAKEIEIAFIEGISKNPQLQYSPFLTDEIVLVCPAHFTRFKKESITLEELKDFPLVLREPGSGTLEVISHQLKSSGIRLNELRIEMHLGSTEGIKSYLAKRDCLAFVSVHAIVKELREKSLRIIDIQGFEIIRPLQLAHVHGQVSGLPALLIKMAEKFRHEI